MNVLVTTERIHLFKFVVKLEPDFVVVHGVGLDVFEFFSDKGVNFESFGLFLGDLFDGVFPSVEFLAGLKFFVEGFDLVCSLVAEVGGDFFEEGGSHGVIGRFFLVFEGVGMAGVVLDEDDVGVGVDFVDDEV